MKGTHQVTCNSCGAEGEVEVKKLLRGGRDAKVIERVPHTPDCRFYERPQPKHLRRGKASVRRQERRANDLVGARETMMSGALGEDGDGRLYHEWREESKQTITKAYRLTQAVWHKLVSGALLSGEEPFLHVQFLQQIGDLYYVVIRRELYDAWSSEALRTDWSCVNALSYRIEKGAGTPTTVPLDPPGVLLTESQFKRLKHAADDEDSNL